jgi:hypothetical protein
VTLTEDIFYVTDDYETKLAKGTFQIKDLPPQISAGMAGLASTFKDGQL